MKHTRISRPTGQQQGNDLNRPAAPRRIRLEGIGVDLTIAAVHRLITVRGLGRQMLEIVLDGITSIAEDLDTRGIARIAEDLCDKASVLSLNQQPGALEPSERLSHQKKKALLAGIRNQVAEIHARVCENGSVLRVRKNIEMISGIIGLTEDEQVFLLHATIAREGRMLSKLFDGILKLGDSWEKTLSMAMGIQTSCVADIAFGRSPLVKCGLIEVDADFDGFYHRFEVLGSLRRALFVEHGSGEELISRIMRPSPATQNQLTDYDYLREEVDMARRILEGALADGGTGVNILLYGPPGTGKTEMSRLLAGLIGATAYDIGESEEAGDMRRDDRFTELRFAQATLGGRSRSVGIFDEMEDLLVEKSGDGFQGSKIMLNRVLETNRVPMIWIANDLSVMPDYVRRRMTFAVHVRIPPARVQCDILQSLAARQGIVVSRGLAEELQRQMTIIPAVARNALQSARFAGGSEADLRRALASVHRVMTGRDPDGRAAGRLSMFRPEFSETDQDIRVLTERLGVKGLMNFGCIFHGAPGTGKSAAARYIAAGLGLQVIEVKGSDVFGPYVGETEAKLAGIFEEARHDRKVLIFDEIDSLLADRGKARQSWEVSQVNELLKQLEDHPFPVFGCTNLVDNLDKAAVRRFLFKVRFSTLPGAKAAACFEHYLGLSAPASIRASEALVPSDFELARRKAIILGVEDPEELGRMVLAEALSRGGAQGGPIGFRLTPPGKQQVA